jgi:hypothetical protein
MTYNLGYCPSGTFLSTLQSPYIPTVSSKVLGTCDVISAQCQRSRLTLKSTSRGLAAVLVYEALHTPYSMDEPKTQGYAYVSSGYHWLATGQMNRDCVIWKTVTGINNFHFLEPGDPLQRVHAQPSTRLPTPTRTQLFPPASTGARNAGTR